MPADLKKLQAVLGDSITEDTAKGVDTYDLGIGQDLLVTIDGTPVCYLWDYLEGEGHCGSPEILGVALPTGAIGESPAGDNLQLPHEFSIFVDKEERPKIESPFHVKTNDYEVSIYLGNQRVLTWVWGDVLSDPNRVKALLKDIHNAYENPLQLAMDYSITLPRTNEKTT